MKKFDRKVWIFILVAAFVIPGVYQVRSLLIGDIIPIYFYAAGVVFSFVVSLSITYVNMALLGRYFDKILPWQNVPRLINRRLFLETLITCISAALIISLIANLMQWIFPEAIQGNIRQVYFDNISVAIIVNLIALSIIEGNSIYLMWKESLLHSEKLKRENIETQFAVLKNQVNPHFLFNSLNVLASLVNRSQEEALEFIGEFSRIYRYIFEVSDETAVEVRRELDFIQAYISLHRKRHGDDLGVSINVNADKLNRFIPALSLQILLENAIKHNEISALHPLKIEIYDEDDYLVVTNNYQPREDKQESLGIGLKNLKERYGFLSDHEPVFMVKDKEYTARIPLLNIEG